MYNIIFYIVSYDIWFYISHLILHTDYFYKTIHKYHHASNYKTMNYKDTYIAHYLETPLQSLGLLVPILFIKFDIYVLIYALLFLNIRGALRHDVNYIWLIGNHHILHHQYSQCNFGEYWLDKLFGTLKKNN